MIITYEDFAHAALNDHDWPDSYAAELEKFTPEAQDHILRQNYELLVRIQHPYFMVH